MSYESPSAGQGNVQYNSPSGWYQEKIEEEKKELEALKQKLLAEYLEAEKEKKDVILLLAKKKQLEEELESLVEYIEKYGGEVEAYNKKAEELKAKVKEFLEKELGLQVEGDPIQELKEYLESLNTQASSLEKKKAVLEKYVARLKQLETEANKLIPLIKTYNEKAEELNKLRKILSDYKISGEEAQWLMAHGYRYMNVNKLIEEYNKKLEELKKQQPQVEEAYKKLENIEAELSDVYTKYKKEYSEYKKAAEEYKAKTSKIQPFLQEYNEAVEELAALKPHVENLLANLKPKYEEYKEKKKEYEGLVESLKKEYSEYLAEVEDVREVEKQLSAKVKELNTWIASYNVFQFFNAGKQLVENINNVLKSIPQLLSSIHVEKQEITQPKIEQQVEVEEKIIVPDAPEPVTSLREPPKRPLMDVEFEALGDVHLPPGLSEEEAMVKGTEAWLEARKVVYEMKAAHELSEYAKGLVEQGVGYEELQEKLKEKQGELEEKYNRMLREDYERAKESIINYQVYKTVPQVRAFIQGALNYLSPANILAAGLHFLGLDKIEYEIAEQITWPAKEGGPVSAGVEIKWPAKEGGPVAFTEEDLARLKADKELGKQGEAPDIAMYKAMGEWWKQHTFVHEYTVEEVEKTNELVAKYTSMVYYPARKLEEASQWLLKQAQEKLESKNPADWILADIALRTLAAAKFAKGAYSAVASLATPWTIALGVSKLYHKPGEVLEYYAKNPFNIYELAGGIAGGYFLGKLLFTDKTSKRGYAQLEPHSLEILYKTTKIDEGIKKTFMAAREEGIIKNFEATSPFDEIVGEASTKIEYGTVGKIDFAVRQLSAYKLEGANVLLKMSKDVNNIYDILALRTPGKVEYIGAPPKTTTSTLIRDIEWVTIGRNLVQSTRAEGVLKAWWGWRLLPFPKPVLKYSIDYSRVRSWVSYESPFFSGGIARTVQVPLAQTGRVAQVMVPSLASYIAPQITGIALGVLPKITGAEKTGEKNVSETPRRIYVPEIGLEKYITKTISFEIGKTTNLPKMKIPSITLPRYAGRVEVGLELEKDIAEKVWEREEIITEEKYHEKTSLIPKYRFSYSMPRPVTTQINIPKIRINTLKIGGLRTSFTKTVLSLEIKGISGWELKLPSLTLGKTDIGFKYKGIDLIKPVEVELPKLDELTYTVQDVGELEKTSLAQLEKMSLESVETPPEYTIRIVKEKPWKPPRRGASKKKSKRRGRRGLRYWTRSWKISPLVSFKKSRKGVKPL